MKLFNFLAVMLFLLDHGVPAQLLGEDVTLNTHLTEPSDMITWYFNGIIIAQINGYLSYTCPDVQCDNSTERFRDRLKLDDQTGSLTITNSRITDSGEYSVEIINDDISTERLFTLTATGTEREPDAGLDAGTVAIIVVFVIVKVCVMGAVWYLRCRRLAQGIQNEILIRRNDQTDVEAWPLHQNDALVITSAYPTSFNRP
ncbi:uncharacterized protein [Chanodichthys erythropterus]|uniref:uncharacterized protein n=1 Tax=Chanodichthys erythropterus TaxID=933992 RepID=UPI00351F137E